MGSHKEEVSLEIIRTVGHIDLVYTGILSGKRDAETHKREKDKRKECYVTISLYNYYCIAFVQEG